MCANILTIYLKNIMYLQLRYKQKKSATLIKRQICTPQFSNKVVFCVPVFINKDKNCQKNKQKNYIFNVLVY